MKVLVYGAGVIGGQLVHALMKSGNDVTVVARGEWKETLQKNGLRIHHYIQKKDTTDHPRVLEKPDEDRHDIVFAVMQYRQMEKILDDLAGVNSPFVVLVGNNLSASKMEDHILQATSTPKQVLFAFGSTAGRCRITRRSDRCTRGGENSATTSPTLPPPRPTRCTRRGTTSIRLPTESASSRS